MPTSLHYKPVCSIDIFWLCLSVFCRLKACKKTSLLIGIPDPGQDKLLPIHNSFTTPSLLAHNFSFCSCVGVGHDIVFSRTSRILESKRPRIHRIRNFRNPLLL